MFRPFFDRLDAIVVRQWDAHGPQAWEQLECALEAGVLTYEPLTEALEPREWGVRTREPVFDDSDGPIYPVLDWWARYSYGRRDALAARDARPVAETALVTHLFDSLEAFPDASMGVVLDVRRQLAGPLIAFRKASADAAQALAEVIDTKGPNSASYNRELHRIVRDRYSPAIAELDASLERSGALSTLRRGLEPAAGGAFIGLSAALGLDEMILLFSGPLTAAALAEARHRRQAAEDRQSHGMFFLWDADRRLKRRARRQTRLRDGGHRRQTAHERR